MNYKPSLIKKLGEIATSLSSIKNLSALENTVDEIVTSIVKVEYSGLYLYNFETKKFKIINAKGFSEVEKHEAERTAMDRHPGWVFKTREMLYIKDTLNDSSGDSFDSKRAFVVRSRLWLPVISNDRPIGAFGFSSIYPNNFNEEHITTLFFVCNLAGVIYENLQLQEIRTKQNDDLIKANKNLTIVNELLDAHVTKQIKSKDQLSELNKNLQESLEREKELNELKTKFVSTASHEFRTPLSAINFAAGSIKRYWTKMDPSMIENKLAKIENQVEHMTQLLDDILIIGQSDAGKMRNNPLAINLGDFINEIIDELDSSFKKSHEIVLIDKEKLTTSTIFIDEKLGRNIFVNLLSNAIKFSPDTKKVMVELSSEKKYTVISITDFGIGIPKSELKNIFLPFNRGKNVDVIQGTGLGLSIVKAAVEVLEGEIIVNSSVNKGTSFIVKIPKKVTETKFEKEVCNILNH
jgi:signal transduction histidine kinase